MLPKLYIIADFETSGATADTFDVYLDKVESCLAAGARLFQMRAKTLSPRQQWELGRELAALVGAYAGTLLVNDRVDLAFAVSADGAHLPADGLPLTAARRVFEQQPLGVSCHTLEEALEAQTYRASFVTLSPVFESKSKPGRDGQGLDWLKECCAALDLPVFALSGVTPDNAADCLAAGAYGVATMSVMAEANDIIGELVVGLQRALT